MEIAQKFISIILTFVGRQIFLQVLSVEYLGIRGLFGDVLGMLTLADLGLATAMAFTFFKPLAEKDENKLAALIQFYRKVCNVIAAIIAIVGVALTPFLRYIINIETDIPNIEVYYLITLANTVISYLFVYKATIITADQNARIITKYQMWTSVIKLTLQIVVLLIVGSYLVYCLVALSSTFATNLLISRKANKLYPFIKRKVKLAALEKQIVFKNIKSMAVFKIADVFIRGTDSILISVFVTTAIVGKYSNYVLAVSSLRHIAYVTFISLSASIGNLLAQETPEKRLRVFRLMQTVSYWVSGFFVFCLFFLLDDFVTLWLGPEFVFDIFTKLAVLLSFYLAIVMFPIYAFREATGMYQKTKYVMVATAVLKNVLAILLGIRFGLVGIIMASFFAKSLTYVWYETKILFRDFLQSRASSYLLGHLLNLCMLSGCIALIHFFFPLQPSANFFQWLVRGIVYTTVINIIYVIRHFNTDEFRYFASKAKEVVKKIKRG